MRKESAACVKRVSCLKSHICTECHASRKYTLCRRCSMCNAFCKDFEKKTCRRLLKPPYVCNGCGKRSVCSLEKRLYIADFAHREYRDILSESRTGLSYSEDEIRYLDEFISPLIRQNQSPHHICATNADYLTVSERTIYRADRCTHHLSHEYRSSKESTLQCAQSGVPPESRQSLPDWTHLRGL